MKYRILIRLTQSYYKRLQPTMVRNMAKESRLSNRFHRLIVGNLEKVYAMSHQYLTNEKTIQPWAVVVRATSLVGNSTFSIVGIMGYLQIDPPLDQTASVQLTGKAPLSYRSKLQLQTSKSQYPKSLTDSMQRSIRRCKMLHSQGFSHRAIKMKLDIPCSKPLLRH